MSWRRNRRRDERREEGGREEVSWDEVVWFAFESKENEKRKRDEQDCYERPEKRGEEV